MLRRHVCLFKSGKHFLALLGFGYTIPLLYLVVSFRGISFGIVIDVFKEFTGDPIYQLENITVTDQRFPAPS